MILSDIRSYLETHGRAARADLAAHFGSDPDALRGMLQKWVAKGRVRKLADGGACGGSCCRCDPQAVEIYEWTG